MAARSLSLVDAYLRRQLLPLRHAVGVASAAAVLSVVLSAALPSAALAQPPGGDTLRLGWDDLLVRIAATSPELARQRLEVARARAAERGFSYFPSFPELEYSTRSDAPFSNVGEGGWEIELMQEIEIGGRNALRREAAGQSVARAELETNAVELALRAQARSAFSRLAAAESRLGLLDTLLGFSRRMDTIAGRLLGAEEISELDRNAIRIERGRVEMERVGASGELAAVRSELAGIIALPPGTIVTTAPGALDAIDGAAAILDTLARIESALASGDESILERRPDWQALDHARDRVIAERTLASRRWIPNLRLGLGYQNETTVTSADPTGHHSAASGSLVETDRMLGFRLGIALPLPLSGLYDLGAGEIGLAEVEMTIIESERTRLAARIRADLARASGRLRAAAEAAAIYAREIAPYITRNIQLLERGYAAGELSATQIVSQQEQFVRTSQSLVDARREYWEAVAEFKRAVGE